MLDCVLESVLLVVLVLDLGNRGHIEGGEMVSVRITETYDMKTTVGKLGVVGIHTPKWGQMMRLYPGLMMQYKYARFKKCDIVGACASVLPADPLQVGVSSGMVAPEDLFNPILMKAVTNEGFDTIVNMIYTANQVQSLGSVNEVETDGIDITADNAMDIYYALLEQNKKWKKAMPQNGFMMRGLVPIAHTLLSTYGDTAKPFNVVEPDTGASVPATLAWANGTSQDGVETANNKPITFRGRSVRMPKFPLQVFQHNGTGQVTQYPDLETFVACLVLPPAKLHEFYYRMRVSWTVEFSGLISTTDYATIANVEQNGVISHGSNYSFAQSKTKLDTSTDSVDTTDVSIKKIMES